MKVNLPDSSVASPPWEVTNLLCRELPAAATPSGSTAPEGGTVHTGRSGRD